MIYQQDADKAIEHEIAELLAASWKCEAIELPALSPIDWYLKRGTKLMAFVEIKDRKNRTRTDFKTVMLNALKVHSLLLAAMAFTARAYFVVRFTDGVFWVDVTRLPGLATTVRGRTDRRDKNDIEPCVEIPVDFLAPLYLSERPTGGLFENRETL